MRDKRLRQIGGHRSEFSACLLGSDSFDGKSGGTTKLREHRPKHRAPAIREGEMPEGVGG
jgi:hypothetical protein